MGPCCSISCSGCGARGHQLKASDSFFEGRCTLTKWYSSYRHVREKRQIPGGGGLDQGEQPNSRLNNYVAKPPVQRCRLNKMPYTWLLCMTSADSFCSVGKSIYFFFFPEWLLQILWKNLVFDQYFPDIFFFLNNNKKTPLKKCLL